MVVVKRPLSPDYGTEVDVGDEVVAGAFNFPLFVSIFKAQNKLAAGLPGDKPGE